MSEQIDADQELLAQAKRQTAALESLRWIAVCWSSAAVLVFAVWLIVLINSGR